jgi:hypothetical protein
MLNIFRKGTLHLGKVLRQRNNDEVLGQKEKGQCSFAAQNAKHLPQRYLAFGKGAEAKEQRRSPGSEGERSMQLCSTEC